MTAVPVYQGRSVTGDVVEVVPRGKTRFGQPFIVETLADDRAGGPISELGHTSQDLAQVGSIHQLQTGDQGGVAERMEMVIVIHQRRCR
jgi:hypothetical protein